MFREFILSQLMSIFVFLNERTNVYKPDIFGNVNSAAYVDRVQFSRTKVKQIR